MELSRRNRRLIAMLACVSALGAVAFPSAAPAAPRAHKSVVGGGRADPAQWPFAVAIFRKGHMHCSGSVIAPTKVLTAGHCVDGFNVANLQVIVGRPTSVTPVPLATPDQNAATTGVGAQLQVAGYGATNPFGTHLSGFLKSTTEQSRTDNRCLKAYTRDLFAPESMICALGAKKKKPGRFKIHTSACSGDSGGPLVANTATGPVEVGTVSYGGALCGLPAAPTVYSRVSASLDFINAP